MQGIFHKSQDIWHFGDECETALKFLPLITKVRIGEESRATHMGEGISDFMRKHEIDFREEK
jgi:hypothetical protein